MFNQKIKKSFMMLVLSLGLAFSYCLPSFASTPDVDFIDVSHHNAEQGLALSFYQTLKESGVNAVVVKVSDGKTFVDPAASVNIANAQQAGMIVHAYHFARFTSAEEATTEAKWFDKKLQLVGFDKEKDGYIVLDLELKLASATNLTEYANIFVQEMRTLGYKKIDLYSGSYFYNTNLIPDKLIISKPWLARYSTSSEPAFVNGKGAWQWSSSYRFLGMPGVFDVSTDFFGKYTTMTKSMNATKTVKKIGSVSLVNYMVANKLDASYNNRAKLAQVYGIMDYRGTSAQNLALLSKLKSGLKPAKTNMENGGFTTTGNTSIKQSQIKMYKVKSGDTLSDIASKYNTTVTKLQSLNGIRNANVIRVGQVIQLTGTVNKQASSTTYHKVVSGDVVSKLAKKYGSTVNQIKYWNQLDKNYTIYTGTKLIVKK